MGKNTAYGSNKMQKGKNDYISSLCKICDDFFPFCIFIFPICILILTALPILHCFSVGPSHFVFFLSLIAYNPSQFAF